jgi:hypothetical protein
MDDVRVTAERLVREMLGAQSTNTATITVNAGGVGLWLAVTCCVVALVASAFLALMVHDQARQIDRLDDYLNAIYAQAPHLKPKESQ